jgi:hypothetical protein
MESSAREKILRFRMSIPSEEQVYYKKKTNLNNKILVNLLKLINNTIETIYHLIV